MPVVEIEIPKVYIDGVKIPEKLMGKCQKIILLKEVGNFDRVILTLTGQNIDVGTIKGAFLEDEKGKKYKLVEVKE